MHSARPSRAVKVLIERGRFRVSHKSYAIESETTTQRGFSRAHSVSKSIAKTARTRGRLFCFTFEPVFYKFARLVSRTSANVMMRIDRVVFFALPEWRRRRRISFFFPSVRRASWKRLNFSSFFFPFSSRERTTTQPKTTALLCVYVLRV